MANDSETGPGAAAVKPRRVFVTGAGGRLGSVVRPVLRAAGHQLVPTDVKGGEGDAEFRVANLLEGAAVREMMAGCDAVVHLGNHASQMARPPAQLFSENVTMTMNVFDAARALGIRRIIYASTIQVVASEWVEGYCTRRPRVAYLPLDGDSPADPTNTYALSKRVGEMVLAQWATEMELEAVSLRLPYLMNVDHPKADVWRQRAKEPGPTSIAQGFSWMSYRDGAELINALLAADWKGARIYLPASPAARTGESAEALLEKYFPGVPRKGAGTMKALVDISAITRETGWAPRDLVF